MDAQQKKKPISTKLSKEFNSQCCTFWVQPIEPVYRLTDPNYNMNVMETDVNPKVN